MRAADLPASIVVAIAIQQPTERDFGAMRSTCRSWQEALLGARAQRLPDPLPAEAKRKLPQGLAHEDLYEPALESTYRQVHRLKAEPCPGDLQTAKKEVMAAAKGVELARALWGANHPNAAELSARFEDNSTVRLQYAPDDVYAYKYYLGKAIGQVKRSLARGSQRGQPNASRRLDL